MPSKLDGNLLRLAQRLQRLRNVLGQPITIHSGYRSPAHNRAVDGVPNSRHLTAEAADFSVANTALSTAYCTTEALISHGSIAQGGLGIYTGHLHYDTRGTRVRGFGDVATPSCPPPKENDMPPDHPTQHKIAGFFLIAAGYTLALARPPKWLREKLRYFLGSD